MQIYRDQVRIFDFLFYLEEPVSGLVMSNMLNCGPKTLKKEIDILNNICVKNGFEIESVVGKGYRIKVYNKALYEEFRRYVLDKYNLQRLYRNFSSERMHYIIRQLLINGSIYIQDIAIDCGCSESTINRDMNKLKERLAEYSLITKNHTNKGTVLYGSEWNRRLALINEEYLFRTFENTYHFKKDEIFNQLFHYSKGLKNFLRQLLTSSLETRGYLVPYSMISGVSNMIILTITRSRFSNDLSTIFSSCSSFELEREIIKEVIKDVPQIYSHDFTDTEISAIAAYLASGRVFRFSEFLRVKNHQQIEAYVEEFIQLLNSRVKIDCLDLTQLNMDLCCEIYHLKIKTDFNLHTTRHDINQFINDGIFHLDMCALLYSFLSEKTGIRCIPNDVAHFYYIFSSLRAECDRVYRKKMIIVMREGLYAARAIAEKFKKMSGEGNIDVVPTSYIDLKKTDMNGIDCIATNIDALSNYYPGKLMADVHYFRDPSRVQKIVKQIMCSEECFRKNYFKKEDIHYTEEINSIDELYDYLKENILLDGDDKEEYISQLKQKESIFSSQRVNQIILLNTIGDILGRSFIKIIVLDKCFEFKNSPMRYIVVYNIQNPRVDKYYFYSSLIANLLHTRKLILIKDRDSDYETLSDIMYGL